MDDRLVGELSCPLDVQDDQVENWQEVDVKEHEGWYNPGDTVEGELGTLSTEYHGVLRRWAESAVEHVKELDMCGVVVRDDRANQAHHHAGDGQGVEVGEQQELGHQEEKDDSCSCCED